MKMKMNYLVQIAAPSHNHEEFSAFHFITKLPLRFSLITEAHNDFQNLTNCTNPSYDPRGF